MVLAILATMLAGPSAAQTVLAPMPEGSPAPAILALDRLDAPPGAAPRMTLPPSGSGVAIVHFFATWCEPCREELPELAAIADRHRVVLVDVAEPEARVRRFFETMPAPGPILLDRDRAASRAWGIEALPASVLLVDGVPRLRADGPLAWTSPEVRARLLVLAGRGEPTSGAAMPDPTLRTKTQ